MASVNFSRGKLKGAKHVKAIFRHCDKDQRLIHEHSNEDINKDDTQYNTDLKGLNYAELCEAYDKRIKEIDENGNKNIRKDRVTCFSLDIPAPEDLDEEKENEWFKRVSDIISTQYGENNFLELKIHRDEIHDYIDAETGKERTSRVHGHAFIIPEHDGGLNGKWFSNRANMAKLNESIHEMSEKEFDCRFMDGSKMKSRKRVETLKNESREAEIQERLREIRVREMEVKDRENEVTAREMAVSKKVVKIKKLQEKVENEWETVSSERENNVELQLKLEKSIETTEKKVAVAIGTFKSAYKKILTVNDDYYKGLTVKKEGARFGSPPLSMLENKQLDTYPSAKRVMSDIAKTAVNTVKTLNTQDENEDMPKIKIRSPKNMDLESKKKQKTKGYEPGF